MENSKPFLVFFLKSLTGMIFRHDYTRISKIFFAKFAQISFAQIAFFEKLIHNIDQEVFF